MKTCPQCRKVYSNLVKVCPDCKIPLTDSTGGNAARPVRPVTPVTPVTPVRPVTPVAPVTPVSTVTPVSPVTPVAPGSAVFPPDPGPAKAPGFWEAVKLFFTHYVDFRTRSRRREFWFACIFNTVLILAFYALGIVGISTENTTLTSIGSVLLFVYSIAILIPGLAVSVRRLHDVGKSGWFYLLNMIPYLGSIILLVFYCMDSTMDNQWGPSPKGLGPCLTSNRSN